MGYWTINIVSKLHYILWKWNAILLYLITLLPLHLLMPFAKKLQEGKTLFERDAASGRDYCRNHCQALKRYKVVTNYMHKNISKMLTYNICSCYWHLRVMGEQNCTYRCIFTPRIAEKIKIIGRIILLQTVICQG